VTRAVVVAALLATLASSACSHTAPSVPTVVWQPAPIITTVWDPVTHTLTTSAA
jgi:hypothetical protein